MPSYIPYESEERLQDPQQQHESMLISFQVFDCPLSYVVSQILGLEAESLTNTELQPVPHGVGAGRVKKIPRGVQVRIPTNPPMLLECTHNNSRYISLRTNAPIMSMSPGTTIDHLLVCRGYRSRRKRSRC